MNEIEKIMKSKLSDEEKIRKLRDLKLTLVDIANLFGRSYSWVYSRINKKYMPLKLRGKSLGRSSPQEAQDVVLKTLKSKKGIRNG